MSLETEVNTQLKIYEKFKFFQNMLLKPMMARLAMAVGGAGLAGLAGSKLSQSSPRCNNAVSLNIEIDEKVNFQDVQLQSSFLRCLRPGGSHQGQDNIRVHRKQH